MTTQISNKKGLLSNVSSAPGDRQESVERLGGDVGHARKVGAAQGGRALGGGARQDRWQPAGRGDGRPPAQHRGHGGERNVEYVAHPITPKQGKKLNEIR